MEISNADKRWVLAATILGSSMVFINSSTVNVAVTALQIDLNATIVEVQWVVNIFMLFLAALMLLGGSLGDHFGRKRIYLIGTIIFSITSILCAVAPNVLALIIARALQGIGGALLVPGSLAIISAAFPQAERGRAIGLWAGFSAITSAGGPVLGGWLVDNFSWRSIFIIIVPLAIAVVAIGLMRVPESRNRAAAKLDYTGALLITIALFAITYALIESSARGFSDPLIISSFLFGLVLMIIFYWWEQRSAEPMLPLVLFQSNTFSGANVLTILLFASLSGIFFLLPQNLIQVQRYSATAAGTALLPFVLPISLMARWAGGLIDDYGARRPLMVGPMITALGFALLALPQMPTSYWTSYFPSLLIAGIGMGVTVAPLTTAVMNAAPTSESGTASGINNLASRLAQLLGVAVMSILVLAFFGRTLDTQLPQLDLPEQAMIAINEQRLSLATLAIPDTLSTTQTEQVQQTVNSGFLAGFRVAMLTGAGFAAFSSIAAWWLIDDEEISAE